MSNDNTVSDPSYTRTSSDEDSDGVEVNSGVVNVDRTVTVEDPLKVVNVNIRGILEQGGVRAVVKPVDFLEYRNDAKVSTSDHSTDVLDGSPASLITQDSLDGLRTIYGIPKSVELRAPLEHERADWDISDWTCFYEYTLRLGFRFPVPLLVRRLLTYFGIAPVQLIPNSWRILLSLTVLREKYNIDFGLGCVLHNYYLKEHVGDQGRYILIPRNFANQLIIYTTTNDRHWKDTFFFAKGPPIDGPWGQSQYVMRRVWNRKDNDVSSDNTSALTEQILHIPAKDRSCKALLVDGKLRPSSLWRWSTLNRTREPYPLVKDFVSYVWTRRSLEILGCKMIFLSLITDIERRFTVTSISNAKMYLPDKANAMQRLRDDLAKKRVAKKNQEVDKSKEDAPTVLDHIYTSSSERNLGRKRQRKDSTVDPGRKVGPSSKKKAIEISEPGSPMILLSSEISSFGEPTGFLKKSSEFLLSADKEILKKKKTEDVFDTSILSAFQALQAQLHLRDRYKLVSDKCAKFKKANDTLRADKAKVDASLKDLEQKVSVLENNLKGMEEERNRYCEESTKAKAIVVEKECLLTSLEDQLTSIASAAMCKARAEIFKEYLSGEHINWKREEMQEVIDTCEEMLKLEGSSSEEGAGETEAAGGDVDKTLNDTTSPNDNVADPPAN
ncbi:hypothetical protein LWI29_007323 [Acer saccharum]|uniref:Transposase (Putative), gypsy type n=1 Tax=Acer saccharum TaxID=4024 RepID=A0AA39SLT8_ACESA|nr:hypothetical protein LWI29_007323 [Acer saccharum]